MFNAAVYSTRERFIPCAPLIIHQVWPNLSADLLLVLGCTTELSSSPVQTGIRGTSPISRGIHLGFQVCQWTRLRRYGRWLPGPEWPEDVLHERLLHGGHHDGREQRRLRRGGRARHAEAHPGMCLHLQPHGLRELHGLSGNSPICSNWFPRFRASERGLVMPNGIHVDFVSLNISCVLRLLMADTVCYFWNGDAD